MGSANKNHAEPTLFEANYFAMKNIPMNELFLNRPTSFQTKDKPGQEK